jgi:hypothetical protein
MEPSDEISGVPRVFPPEGYFQVGSIPDENGAKNETITTKMKTLKTVFIVLSESVYFLPIDAPTKKFC